MPQAWRHAWAQSHSPVGSVFICASKSLGRVYWRILKQRGVAKEGGFSQSAQPFHGGKTDKVTPSPGQQLVCHGLFVILYLRFWNFNNTLGAGLLPHFDVRWND